MLEYIYFVKCPDCEDEHFSFFDEAKKFALSCINKKPIITQVEVDRNDFGECIDSTDCGTVWSWEDNCCSNTDCSTDPEPKIFSKKDLLSSEEDVQEFLDSSVADNFNPSTPSRITLESLVEEMEKNEDTVECKWCNELFDKSECRYEVDLGYLCPRCEAAIKSRGETLTFREGTSANDILSTDSSQEDSSKSSLTETAHKGETVDLDYDKLTITLFGPKRDVDDWDEEDYTSSYTYTVDKNDVATTIWENFLTDEDVEDVPGGMEALEDEEKWQDFLKTHFDSLFEKYYDNLLDFYEEQAREAFSNEYTWEDYEYDAAYDNAVAAREILLDEQLDKPVKNKSMLETLEDPEAYKERLLLCPECGQNSYDKDTCICIKCGFNTI